MFGLLGSACRKIFTTVYQPDPSARDFLSRAETQSNGTAEVTATVLSAEEARRLTGVPLARRGIQPVYLRITNRHHSPLRLEVSAIDPHYFTPLEAAARNHFSMAKRLSLWGIVGWYFFPIVLLLLPSKLITAARANRRMDALFRAIGFPLRPIDCGQTVEGFVFTTLDSGMKAIDVLLHDARGIVDTTTGNTVEPTTQSPAEYQAESLAPAAEFTFSIVVPGLKADYQHRDFNELCPADSLVNCDLPELASRLAQMPAATANAKDTRHGDPVNLVVIAEFDALLSAFAARWDESETITLASCWRTARAFLRGTEYRYSPVSPLHLFGRSQDVALQRIRRSINERLHLRLWMTPLRFQRQPVWVGQISRDIGVRFTTKAWNLTTHRIDPDVDESRDYVVEDLLRAERVAAVGYVGGVSECSPTTPRHNLTGDPYYTDGKRAVILLGRRRHAGRKKERSAESRSLEASAIT